MAYEPKPGSLSLFKNDRKEKDSHPDYRGDGLDLDDRPVWVSAWIKKGAKGTFMSLSLQPKERQSQSQTRPNYAGADEGEWRSAEAATRTREDSFRGAASDGLSGGRSRSRYPESSSPDLDDEIPFITRESAW